MNQRMQAPPSRSLHVNNPLDDAAVLWDEWRSHVNTLERNKAHQCCHRTTLRAVAPKTPQNPLSPNEIRVTQALLPCLSLAGRLCTADAMHTQTDFLERADAPQRQDCAHGQKEPAHPLR
jgi:hypothetical protein